VEDVPTGHLKYLLVEYYLASLLLREGGGNLSGTRAAILREARLGFEAFVRVCAAMGAISPSEASWGAILKDEGSRGSLADSDIGSEGSSRKRDPALLRAEKIERFKRSQAVKRRLAELSSIHSTAMAGGRGGKDLEDGVGGRGSAAGGGGDEDTLREMALLSLSVAAYSALDEVSGIDSELPLLKHKASLESESGQGGRGGLARQAWDPRMKPPNDGPPPGDISIDPDRPGLQITRIDPTWTVQKETIKADIFKSGHK